jgi:hypothetical protein
MVRQAGMPANLQILHCPHQDKHVTLFLQTTKPVRVGRPTTACAMRSSPASPPPAARRLRSNQTFRISTRGTRLASHVIRLTMKRRIDQALCRRRQTPARLSSPSIAHSSSSLLFSSLVFERAICRFFSAAMTATR